MAVELWSRGAEAAAATLSSWSTVLVPVATERKAPPTGVQATRPGQLSPLTLQDNLFAYYWHPWMIRINCKIVLLITQPAFLQQAGLVR